MTPKAARRWISRNRWKLARRTMDKDYSGSFMKRFRIAKMVLGDVKLRRFDK